MRNPASLVIATCLLAVTAVPASAESMSSKDGRIQVDIPEGWRVSPSETTAQFHFENTTGVIEVVYEAKIDFEAVDSLQTYAELTLKTLAKTSKLTNRKVSEGRHYKLGDHDVIEYRITGARDSRKSVLLYIFMESNRYWNQFVLVSPPSQLDQMRPSLEATVLSFREIKK